MRDQILLVAIVATLANIVRQNVYSLAKKRGNSVENMVKESSIICPFVCSEGIPYDTRIDIKKAHEINLAYKIKTIIERQIFSEVHQVQLQNVMMFLPVHKMPNGAVGFDMAKITESRANEDQFIKESLDFISDFRKEFNITKIDVHEKAGDEIGQPTRATPTYITVELSYITYKGEIKSIKNTIQIELTPYSVKNIELQSLIRKHDGKKLYRNFANVVNKREKFLKDFLFELKEITALARAQVNKNNSIIHYMDKTAYLSKMFKGNAHPYAYLLIDEYFVREMKDVGLDLENDTERAKTMEELLISNISIYNPATDIISTMNNGDTGSVKYKVDDFTMQASKIDTQLKELIRLNKSV